MESAAKALQKLCRISAGWMDLWCSLHPYGNSPGVMDIFADCIALSSNAILVQFQALHCCNNNFCAKSLQNTSFFCLVVRNSVKWTSPSDFFQTRYAKVNNSCLRCLLGRWKTHVTVSQHLKFKSDKCIATKYVICVFFR